MAYKRHGRPTKDDKAAVARVVLAEPGGELSVAQVRGLAMTLRKSRECIRKMVDEARENFAADAPDYVRMHRQATEQALQAENYDAALKGAQWAINHISLDGTRLTEKETAGPTGSRILIGIRVGGVNQKDTAIDVPAVTETE